MSFHSWLQNLRSALAPGRGQRNHRRRFSLGAATHRLHLEALEDRCLLAFLGPVDYDIGLDPLGFANYPLDVKAGDFNGDAVLDLVTANYGDSTVSVLLGNADGTFQQPAQTFAISPYPASVAVGDFNADGTLDLASPTDDYYGTGDNDVSILLGNGDGTFADGIPQNIGLNTFVGSIAAGDLNADGKLDLVVTSYDWYGGSGGYVSVLLGVGDGDGNFAPATTYGPYNGNFSSLALADFNNDGNADVVTTKGSFQVFLGNGDGTLQPPRNVVVVLGNLSVVVGDFNADGNLDLAALTTFESVNVVLGNGDGTFQTVQTFSVGHYLASATAGDVDGDGVLDLVVTGSTLSATGAVSVLLGNGDGSFALPITTAAAYYSDALVVADFNADGLPDAAVADRRSATLQVFINDDIWSAPDVPRISIDNVTKKEGGNSKTTLFAFTVTLSAASDQAVTVNYATASGTATAGTDYLSKTGTVTFAPGETTKTITISVKGDKTKEADETFFVNLTNASGATIDDGQGLGTILNDDGGSAGNNRLSSTWAVDAAIEQLMSAATKKRSR